MFHNIQNFSLPYNLLLIVNTLYGNGYFIVIIFSHLIGCCDLFPESVLGTTKFQYALLVNHEAIFLLSLFHLITSNFKL